MKTGNSRPPEDDTMKRLLPDFFRPQNDHPAGSGTAESLNSALRSLHEPEIIDAKRDAAQRVLDTVPDGGGRFELTEDDAHAGPLPSTTSGWRWARCSTSARTAPTGCLPDHPMAGPLRRVPVADGAAGVPGAGADGISTRDERSITDVGGIRVGHHHRLDADATLGSGWASGTTVVLTPPGTVGAVDVPRRRARHPGDRPAGPDQPRALRRRRAC